MKDKLELVVGRHAVSALLQHQPEQIREIIIASDENVLVTQRLLQAAKSRGIKVSRVPKAKLDSLVKGTPHQGVAAILASASYAQLEDIIAACKEAGTQALVLVANHIQDPHNLGALIRSAAAVGAQGVVIAKDRACQLTPLVAKAAAGALALMPVCRVVNIAQAIARLQQEAGLWSLAADAGSHPAPWQLDLNRPLALIIGGEHKGVGSRLLDNSDMLTSLPLHPQVESLNASVAAGVLLFEITRQRNIAAPAAGNGREITISLD